MALIHQNSIAIIAINLLGMATILSGASDCTAVAWIGIKLILGGLDHAAGLAHSWCGGLFNNICAGSLGSSLISGGRLRLVFARLDGVGLRELFFVANVLFNVFFVLSVQILYKFVEILIEMQIETAVFVLFVLLVILAEIFSAIDLLRFPNEIVDICMRCTSFGMNVETVVLVEVSAGVVI